MKQDVLRLRCPSQGGILASRAETPSENPLGVNGRNRRSLMRHHRLPGRAVHSILAAAVCAAFAASASAQRYPTQHRYLTKPLKICDQGIFYVGGAPKVTPFGAGPTAGPYTQIIIGSMYVHFQVPMVSRTWPLIMVHGSGYTGSSVEGTAAGSEGWMDYTVRHGITTYVVDQAGRGRSGFDKSVIHEGEALIDADPAAAKALIPTLGGSTSTAWTSWFGHIIRTGPDGAGGPVGRRPGHRVAHGNWSARGIGNRKAGCRWPRQPSLPIERSVSGLAGL